MAASLFMPWFLFPKEAVLYNEEIFRKSNESIISIPDFFSYIFDNLKVVDIYVDISFTEKMAIYAGYVFLFFSICSIYFIQQSEYIKSMSFILLVPIYFVLITILNSDVFLSLYEEFKASQEYIDNPPTILESTGNGVFTFVTCWVLMLVINVANLKKVK